MATTSNFKPRGRGRVPQGKQEAAHKINGLITAPVVRIVGDGIEPEVLPTKDAVRIAENMGLDLVEISPTATPPVCKVVEYSRFLYEQKKKQKEIKAKSAKVVVKEIRLSPQIDDHDFNFKLKHAIEFLKEGSKVKVEVFFKGRTIVYKEQGEVVMLKFAQELIDYGKIESMPKLEGKRMIMMVTAKKQPA